MTPDPNYNILEKWRQHYQYLSSPLHPNPIYPREHVDFIYKSFMGFWGLDFFKTTMLEALDKDKDYYLFSMLGTPTHASFYYLMETALLLAFAQQNYPDLLANLHTVRKLSDKSKECLFELYIAFLFHKNNIPFTANVVIDGKQKDGYANLHGEHFLIECKKKYSVISDSIAIYKYLSKEIIKMMQGIPHGFEGIGVVNITAEKYNRSTFTSVLKSFKNYLVTRTEYHPTQLIADANISFEIIDYNEANRIALANNLIQNTLYFTVQDLHRTTDNDHLFHLHLYMKGKAPGEQTAKKLIATLSKIRKQHNDQTDIGRIFFIDGEFLNDFVSPLLHFNESYEQSIRDYLARKDSKDIVIILIRNFTGKLPEIKASVICKPGMEAIQTTLQQMNFYTVDPDFFRRS